MDKRFIIIIWHQAGRDANEPIYYSLNDDNTESALVFRSEAEAVTFWEKHKLSSIHAGFVVEVTTKEVDWI